MSTSSTFPSDTVTDLWGIRILTCRLGRARALRLVALSATVVAVNPGPAPAADGELRSPGRTAANVRFEPLQRGPGGLSVAGTGTYRGAVEVRRNGRSLAVVNDVGFEDYVRGIDEVPPSWPAAALEAQAIAARTYAAHFAASRGTTPWRAVGADICATPRCQVYRGLDTERTAQGQGWLPAVEATAGRVLLSGGRPIMASYSATANGPLAMSQNGARAMAMEGRSASDILSAYYGIRPTLAPGQVPATIRVALSTGTGAVRVSAAGPFRVLDGNGGVLAVAAGGEWMVVPEGDGVRVVPPATHQQQLSPPGAVGAEGTAVSALPAAVSATAPGDGGGRGPARVITASAPLPGLAPWALVAAALASAAGSGAATLRRRLRT